MGGFVSVRTDVTCNPAGVRLADIGGDFVRCTYGESLDAAEECVLTLRHDHPVLGSLAIRNVLRVRNELDEVREYRIRHLYDSLTDPTVTIKATPILHDVGDTLLQRLVSGVWTDTFTASLSPRGWLQLICDHLAQRGQPWWSVGTVDIDGSATIPVAGESGLAIARRLVEGTLASVLAERDGDTGYTLSARVLIPTQQPLIVVGRNVVALDREIHADAQVTIVTPTGMLASGDTAPQGVEEVPWVIDAMPGAGVLTISDHEASDATLAIEDDQYVGDSGVAYADKALVGLLPPPVLLTVTGDTGAELTRCGGAVRIGTSVWVAIRRGTSVGQLHVIDLTTGTVAHTYDLSVTTPASLVYVASADRIFVASTTDGEIDVVDPSDGSVESTLTLAGVSWLHHDATNDRIWAVATAGLVIIDPSDGTTESTIATATMGATLAACRLAEGGDSIWATGDASGTLSLVKCDVATMAWTSTTDISGDVLDDADAYTRLAWDDTNDRLWLAAADTGDLLVLDDALAVVNTVDATIHGMGGCLSLVAWGGEVFAGGAENQIACFVGDTLVMTEVVHDGAVDTYTDNAMMSLLGDGWYVHGGTDTTRTSFYLRFWSASSHGGLHRRTIVSSDQSDGSVTVEATDLTPWQIGDAVWIVNDDGTRFRELWSPLAVSTYGQIAATVASPDRRSERNLVVVPTPEDYDDDERPIGWDVPEWTLDNLEHRRHDADALAGGFYLPVFISGSARTTENWQTLLVRGLPGGFIAQPGDILVAWNGSQLIVAHRTVVASLPAFTAYDTYTTSDTPLSSYTFSDPGTTGITGYEATDAYWRVAGYLYGNTFGPSAAHPIRVNADFKDDEFELVADIARFPVDATNGGGGVCFHVRNTAIGSFDNRGFYSVLLYRADAAHSNVALFHYDESGTVTTVAGGATDYSHIPSGVARRLRVTVSGLTCTVYISDAETGANESLVLTATLPVDYRGSNHLRVGVLCGGSPSSGQYVPAFFGLTDLENLPAAEGADTSIVFQSTSTASYSFGIDTSRYYRPDPALLQDHDEWFVLPFISGQSTYSMQVYIPPALRPGQTLHTVLGGWWFGGTIPEVHATLTNFQSSVPVATKLVDESLTVPITGNGRDGGLSPVELSFTTVAPTEYGWYTLTLVVTKASGGPGVTFGAFLGLTASVYWGTDIVPAFGRSNGGGWLWKAGQEYLLNRSSPLSHYLVRAVEDNSELPFLLGAKCRLRDAERGLSTDTVRIIAVRRELLPRSHDVVRDPPQPEIELDNRPLELIAQLVSKGSV